MEWGYFLCPQDWQRRIPMGNMMQKSFFEIWNSAILNKYRKKHLNGDRSLSPVINVMLKEMFTAKNMQKSGIIIIQIKRIIRNVQLYFSGR